MVWDEENICRKKCDRTEATVVAEDTNQKIVDGGCSNENCYNKPKYEDDKLIFPDKEREKQRRDRNRKKNRKKNKQCNKSRKKNR